MVPPDIEQSVSENLGKLQQRWEFPDNISAWNRAIITNWVWKVFHDAATRHEDPRAVCLAITLFDCHLAHIDENKDRYQLIAIAALWIGTKVHWSMPFEAHTLLDLSDYIYTREQLVATELALLRENDYAVTGALLPDYCTVSTDLLRLVTADAHLLKYAPDELGATLTEIEGDDEDPPEYPDCYDAVIDVLPL
jgi:hypothetical protein